MKTIKFSVIVPHHNTPRLLIRLLDSIPDRQDIQVIVVDDNSDIPIQEWDTLKKQIHSNVSVKLTKEGKGAGYARNVGLSLAKGEWLMFADADDYYAPDTFNIIENNLNDTIDILYYCVDKEPGAVNSRAEIVQ